MGRTREILKQLKWVFLAILPCTGLFAQVNTFPYYEDFESDNGGYVSGGTNDSWAYGTPNKPVISGAGQGSRCWVNGGLTGNYNSSEASTLTSPTFDFSSLNEPEIIFLFVTEMEFSWEWSRLEYSINGGSWTTLGNSSSIACQKQNWFNHSNGWTGRVTGSGGSCGSTGCGSATFCGQWTEARHCIGFLAGQSDVRFRWRFGAGSICQDEGFGVDSIVIQEADANIGFEVLSCNSRQVSFQRTLACDQNRVWDFGDGNTSTSASPTNTYVQGGTYVVSYAADGNCGVRDTVYDTINVTQVELPNDTVICSGGSFNLVATPGFDLYTWSSGFPASTFNAIPITTDGAYSVTVTDSLCSSEDSILIGFLDQIGVDLGNDTTFCEGESITLEASYPLSTNQWNDGSAGTELNVSGSGQYWVQVTNACGLFRDTINVQVIPSPLIGFPSDPSVCETELPLTIGVPNEPNETYQWSTGATTSTITVNNAGTFVLNLDSAGCVNTDTMIVEVDDVPDVDIPDTGSCDGLIAMISAPGGYDSYLWSDGSTSSSISTNTVGTQWVQVTNGACTMVDSFRFEAWTDIELDLLDEYTFCDGQNMVVSPPNENGISYAWSDGTSADSFMVTSKGFFTVTATNACDQVTEGFTVLPGVTPQADLGPDTYLCDDESERLRVDVDSFTNILWNTGDTTVFIDVDDPGEYWVRLTSACGTDFDTIQVLEGEDLRPLTPDLLKLCDLDFIPVKGVNPGASYFWSNGMETDSITVFEPGTYWLESVRCNTMRIDTFYVIGNVETKNLVPNVFTPNGDGINDRFFIPSAQHNPEVFSLEIYNRWGQRIYDTSGPRSGWNGESRLDGTAPAGVYYFVVTLESPCNPQGKEEVKGSLQLVR